MKVYNLACEPADHRFEGWFGSEQDYLAQSARQLLTCPICGSLQIKKLLSAPRINLGRESGRESGREAGRDMAASAAPGTTSSSVPVDTSGGDDLPVAQMQAALMQLARKVIANTEDVGEDFAEEARRIHYDEAPARGIRGVVSREERAALQDEGIDVMALPMPELVKETLQ